MGKLLLCLVCTTSSGDFFSELIKTHNFRVYVPQIVVPQVSREESPNSACVIAGDAVRGERAAQQQKAVGEHPAGAAPRPEGRACHLQ